MPAPIPTVRPTPVTRAIGRVCSLFVINGNNALVTRVGITGHTNLAPESVRMVAAALRTVLTPYSGAGFTGISCIASGADSIFAEVVLQLGGELEVVLPSADYRTRGVKPDQVRQFDELLARADRVTIMPHARASRAAYEAANQVMLDSVDILVAVWDGMSSVDQGGTAAVVEQARTRGMAVTVVWPDGARREE